MKYFLGIDGGGTRTTACVTDENGAVITKKIGKTINFYSVGMDKSHENLSALMNEIYDELGNIRFNGAFIGCSALDSEADSETVKALCGESINAEKIKMNSDVFIALKSVDSSVCPCVVICGTGSMAIGEDEAGNTFTSGGWGHIIGDEGSAYSIAVNALKMCCMMCDKGENTPLLSKANEYFKTEDYRQIIDIVYSNDTSKDVIAGFSANVGKLAEDGDEKSLNIILSEAEKISDTVMILLQRIGKCEVLGLYGGVFQHNKIFKEAFENKIKKYYPDIKIQLLTLPPEESAARLARDPK